jgi:ferritin-like metal-binding protein YciE
MDVIEILHSLMKKQRMNHESRVSRIGKLRKSFGSDESLWLAEVGRQQAIVDALGDQARRPRDDEMPRRFRQHALEYIKELVGVEAAMSILEDISKGKQKRSIDLSKKLFDGVILKHECFRPLQKSRKLFIDWRDSAERNNRSLIMNFIRENGTHEQKARLEAILLATSKRKRKRQQCSTLVDLAYAASQLRQEDGSTSGVEDGVTVGAEGGGGGFPGMAMSTLRGTTTSWFWMNWVQMNRNGVWPILMPLSPHHQSLIPHVMPRSWMILPFLLKVTARRLLHSQGSRSVFFRRTCRGWGRKLRQLIFVSERNK